MCHQDLAELQGMILCINETLQRFAIGSDGASLDLTALQRLTAKASEFGLALNEYTGSDCNLTSFQTFYKAIALFCASLTSVANYHVPYFLPTLANEPDYEALYNYGVFLISMGIKLSALASDLATDYLLGNTTQDFSTLSGMLQEYQIAAIKFAAEVSELGDVAYDPSHDVLSTFSSGALALCTCSESLNSIHPPPPPDKNKS